MFKILEFITETIGWLQIVASPLLIGLGIGALIYFSHPTNLGMIAGLSIAALGLVIGIIWASRVWKKYGTMRFLSRIIATPELDEKKEFGDDSYI
jgi:hypothetical protein